MSLNDRQITASALQGMIVPFATVRHSNLRRPERLCALRDHRQRHPRRGGLAAQRGLFDSLHEKTFARQALGGGVEVASGIYCFRMCCTIKDVAGDDIVELATSGGSNVGASARYFVFN
jgi:hypothetical protein